jgi:hypothetical protein
MRYGRYPVKRDSYEPSGITVAPAPMIFKAAPKIGTVAAVPQTGPAAPLAVPQTGPLAAAAPMAPLMAAPVSNTDNARNFWRTVNLWIDAWTKDGVTSISESIPNSEAIPLSSTILKYVEQDSSKKDNIEIRLKKLQWWGHAVLNSGVANGIVDLRLVARQFAWDSFLKGQEQIALLKEGVEYAEAAAEPFNGTAGSVQAYRCLDNSTKEPFYICSDGPCPPSVLQIFTGSKTDEVINSVANQRTAAPLYGFMVPWENTMMFKTNVPSPEGKPPGGGAACSIVSNVSGHRKKLVELGDILATQGGHRFDLTDATLTGARKLQGAPNFCALLEIVLRWMDVRRGQYGGRRFFYRPLASYYSKHKSKK